LTIYKNQQAYKWTLNPDSPPEWKRQKTISENQNMTNLIHDIDDSDVIITYKKNSPLKPCVMLYGFPMDIYEIFKMVFCT